MTAAQEAQVVKVWPVESDSSPGFFYDVIEWSNGKLTCNCPSFIRGKQQKGKTLFERECKHQPRAEKMRQDFTLGVFKGMTPAKAPSKDPFAILDEAEKERLR